MKYILFFISFLFFTFFIKAQPNVKTNWLAQWIGIKSPSIPNSFFKFSKKYTIENIPKKVILNIATDSKYWLYINGKLCVFEGQLKRGPTPNDTYFDEVEVSSYLKNGINDFKILVWYWGKDGFCHKNSGKMGLLFELELPNKKLVSDKSWKIAQHLAYQNSSEPNPNFRLPEHNVRYDARLDNEEWLQNNFDDGKWQTAAVISNASEAPWNALWKRPIPLWHDGGLVNYENNFAKNGTVTMKLPRNISITPYFKIQAPAGLLIDIRADNYFGGGAPNIRTEYITKDGVQEFETPAFVNGHEVIYSFPVGVKILDVKYRETKYATKHVGYFNSNDNFYNTLWTKSATTLNINMRDAIQDSPDRERAQWWGDVAIVLEEIFYTCDANGVDAIKKAISNLLEWQKKDSVLFSPIPAGNWDKELPAQMLAAVGKYGIGKYIEQSGDTAMIRYAYPFIKKYMALWKLNNKGLVTHRDGGWSWQDWGDKIDEPLLDNAWYYMALETCNKMAMHLKLNSDALEYKNKMQSIATNFQKYFWKGNHFASDEYKFYADDRGNGLAICAGLATKNQWQLLKPMLDTIFYAGPYLEKYILESYFIMKDAASGLARMKTRYTKMVESKLTTLWEGWDVGSATYGGGTYNHGWTGGPLSLMSGYVAGIRSADGFENYSILPQISTLKNVSCGTNTAKGFIKVLVVTSDNKTIMEVETIKANGIIAFPKLKNKNVSISINGKAKSKQMKFLREDEQYIYFSCREKGKYEIVSLF